MLDSALEKDRTLGADFASNSISNNDLTFLSFSISTNLYAFSLAKIYKLRDKIYREKVKAVHKFNKMAKSTKFVSSGNLVKINNGELQKFKKKAKLHN